ncbi:MAG: YIP1 family protein [Anaerolineaceae bacterium]|nr:YIP1 family protein [Anaerolineaceae bacterium]
MTESAASPPVTSDSPHFFGMVWGVLAKPRITFATLRDGRSRAWILMSLVGIILAMLPVIASGPISAQATRQQLEDQFANQPGFASGVDAEQAASFATSPILTTVVPAVLGAFGRIISWLLWSGSLYLLASMVGGRSTFGQLLQVVVWAWLPYALRSIVQAVYITATQTLIANQGLSGFAGMPTPDPSNPFAAELPSAGTAVLYAFLGQIDIYLFWHLALLVIGITAVTKLSRRKSIGLVLIVWAVFMAVRLVGTAVSTSLASGFLGG